MASDSTIIATGPPKLGSGPGLVQFLLGRQRQEAGPQQFDPGTSIHSSLEGLQAVDVTFRRTVAPDLFHCVLYRGPVFLQLPDESHDHFDRACLGFRGPASQTGHAATAQDAAKVSTK